MINIKKEKEILQLIKYKLLIHKCFHKSKRTFYSFKEICEELDLSSDELLELIEKLNVTSNQTFPVEKIDGKHKICHFKKEYKIHEFNIPKKSYKIGFLSDKHVGHKNDRMRYVHSVYEEGDKRGVDMYFDAGDLLNGPRELAKDEENIKIGDLEEALIEAKRFHISDKPTYLVPGNHDLGFMLINKCDIGRLLEQECDNIFYLNDLFAPVEVNGLRVNISHGYIERKYLRYVKLYKEQCFLTINEPHLIVQGHFHLYNLSEKNNTILCELPSLRFGDEHLKNSRKLTNALGNSIGAVFLTVHEFENELELRFDEMHFIEENTITNVAEYTKKK